MKLAHCALFAALMLGVPTAFAANLEDIYNAAKDNDPVVRGAAANYAASKQAVPQARAALLPNAFATGQSTWNERSFPVPPIIDTDPTSPTFGTLIDIPDQEFNEHFWQAQISQAILDLPSWFNYRAAKASVKQAKHGFAGIEQALVVRAVEAYLNVLRAQDLLESTLAEEAAVKRQLEQVQQRFDVGLVAITDVLESQAAYDNAVVRRIQAEGDHDIFFETLSTLTGRPFSSLDRLSERLPIVNPDPQSEAEWVETALAENYAVRAALAAVSAARRNVRAQRSGHLPTIDATISHNHFVTGGQSVFGRSGVKTDTTVYGAQITLPLFQGGFTRARTKEAVALADQAREQLAEQQLTVSRDTRNLFRAVATDVVRVKARLKAIKSSESALEATETGYEVGTRNIVDVLQAQQRLFASQFDYADSRYNYVINLMRLKQAAGTLLDQDLLEVNRYTDANAPVTRLNYLPGNNPAAQQPK